MEAKQAQPEAAMSETMMEIHPRKRGALPMEWTEYEVRRDGESDRIATFANESDALRFVAGEKAIEAVKKARHALEVSTSVARNEYRAGEGIDVCDWRDEEIDEAIKLIDSALSALPAEETK